MTTLQVGGRAFPGVEDLVRRYTGRSWSGGADETWAWRYYDAIPDAEPDLLLPLDVVVAGAIGPGPSPADLVWFHRAQPALSAWLSAVQDRPLASATDAELQALDELVGIAADGPSSLSLLTKVLHRKRPQLVPMLDRAMLDAYRHVLPSRESGAAWPTLVRAMAEDLRRNDDVIAQVLDDVSPLLETPPSALRIVDITVWLTAATRRHA